MRLRQLVEPWKAANLQETLRAIAQLAAAECGQAIELFRRLPSEDRRVLHRALGHRWASLDLEGALQAALMTRDMEVRQALTEAAAREWVQRDPEAALARIAQSSSTLQQIMLGRFVLHALAEDNPARAAEFLAANPKFARDTDIFATVGTLLARLSSQQALTWAKSLPAGQARGEALRAVWTAWAEKEPVTVAAHISQGSEKDFDRQVFTTVARTWSKSDPAAAMAWIESLNRVEDQNAAWAAFTLDVRQLGPQAALELVEKIPSEQRRADVATRVASQLAQDDLASALAWIERLPDGTVRNQALRPVLDQWMRGGEPVEAVSYVASLPASQARTDLLRRTVGNWAGIDGNAAVVWVRQLPAGTEREQVAVEAGRGMREFEPAKAVQLLDLVQNAGMRQQFVEDIAGQWAKLDGTAAAEWLNKLPDATEQVRGYYSVARQWTFADSQATERWLTSLSPGASRDAAIHAFVSSIDGYDPALVTRWANAIQNPKEREDRIGAAWLRWNERDAAAARIWAERAELSEELRTILVRRAETKKSP